MKYKKLNVYFENEFHFDLVFLSQLGFFFLIRDEKKNEQKANT